MTLSIGSTLEKLFNENPELNIPVHEYNINVTTNLGEKISADTLFEEYRSFNGADKDTHLYMHLPLCDYICHFCNYVKRKINSNTRTQELQKWADLLIQESQIYLDNIPWMKDAVIRSFYIGGGTGALLLNDEISIRKLMCHINNGFSLSKDCELSIEGNPENFTRQTIDIALNLGFNRFSVGVQSLHDEVNKFTNRGHSAAEALDAIMLLKSTGKPFSVDMMFGLPLQTPDSVAQDIQELVNMDVPSITIYRLRNSDREKMGIGNTSVWNKPHQKNILDSRSVFPSVLDTYQMRDAITTILRNNDYHPSPCGWWNKPGIYSEGNIPRVSKDKWEKNNTMLAFGPGAYGWLTGGNSRSIQTHNITNISQYITHLANDAKTPPISHGRILYNQIAVGTRLTYAFKANQPIFLHEYKSQFDVNLLIDEPYADVFRTLIEKDFMSLSDDYSTLLPTWKGEELHEEIMYTYFQDRIGSGAGPSCKRVSVS